jgi:pseudouridine-5'-phosphate glycosidase
VIGLGTDTLPAFYSRSSGLPVDVSVPTPAAAAQIIAAAHRLNAQHGLLVTVPVPAQDELPVERTEAAIRQATDEAAAKSIHGNAVTPFLLGRVAELTDGASRRANIALLVNNARVGGQIAAALAAM